MLACVSPACTSSSGARRGPSGVLPAAEGVWVFQHRPAIHRTAGWGGGGSRGRTGPEQGLRLPPNRPCAPRNTDKWGVGYRCLPCCLQMSRVYLWVRCVCFLSWDRVGDVVGPGQRARNWPLQLVRRTGTPAGENRASLQAESEDAAGQRQPWHPSPLPGLTQPVGRHRRGLCPGAALPEAQRALATQLCRSIN